MARRKQWRMNPAEVLELAVSMASELDSAASMTGETPTVSVWTRTGSQNAGYTYSAASGFTISNAQVNVSALTTEGGETIAIGEGIAFRLTAGAAGTYYIRSECDADDGTHVVREDVLVVAGAGAPS